jgi:hypothetical protein
LKGGLLEALGKLFANNVKLYIYPTLSSVSIDDPTKGDKLLTTDNMPFPEDVQDLYNYLKKNRKILVIEHAKVEWLYINPRRVLRMIHEGSGRLGKNGSALCGKTDQIKWPVWLSTKSNR